MAKDVGMKTDRYQNRIELLQGTLDLLVLQTLLWGPQHGYGISQVISQRSGDVLAADTGSLYPALHRLERKRWIAAEWKISENKQRVRVYRLTRLGRKQLAQERSRWERLTEAVAGILNPAAKETE
jgi:PadR family transcriptional regulator, regulatory protein PadR